VRRRQVGLESKRLEAARAAEPLGTGVRLHVCAQVGPVSESFATHGASKGFLYSHQEQSLGTSALVLTRPKDSFGVT